VSSYENTWEDFVQLAYDRAYQTSQVLPGLTMAFIQETLKRSLTQEHGAVTRWIINQFS
jgi:hypothetical protein